MKNDDITNGRDEISDESTPSSRKIQADGPAGKSKTPKNKSPKQKKQKWSLWRHWKTASRAKQVKWVAEGVGIIIAALILVTYVVGLLQTKENFTAEHRPRVIISRPPVLYGSIACQVTENGIHIESGPMRLWVKEIGGKGNAVNAFVAGPEFKLVPEKEIGVPILDDPPSITDNTCRMKVTPKMKEFPVYVGQEVDVDVAQVVGSQSLIKSKSVSVTFGGPQPEPEPPLGEKREGVHVDKDAIFQLYAPICVYYSDQDGMPYGSCRTYRMSIGGTGIPGSGRYGFSCTGTPVKGDFDASFGSFCDN